MAPQALVHKSPTDGNRSTKEITTDRQSDLPTQNNECPSKPRATQFDSLAALDRNFKISGFSKRVRQLLMASWRKGTQADYVSKFKSSIAGVVNGKNIPIQHL